MWSQSWANVYSLMIPYPDKASVDVTEQMKQQVCKQVYVGKP